MKNAVALLIALYVCFLAVPIAMADCTSQAWSSTTAYALGAQVTYNGYSWQSTVANTNSVPQAGTTVPQTGAISDWQINNYCGAAPGPATGRTFAPYVDVSISPTFQLTANMTNVSPYYTLAFIIDSGGCTAA